jgi:O-antigen ligase
MAAMQFIFKRGFIESGFNRVSGTFLHPNGFSQYLTMVFLVVFYLIQSRERTRKQRLFLYGYLGVVASALFMTYTRGAWIGVSAAFMFFLFVKNSFRTKAGYFILALIVLAALMPTIQKRFSEVEKRKQEDLSSWQWRIQQWKQTADFVREDPVVGKGIGVFEIVFDIGVHNDYLRIAYETGFSGLLSYVGLLLYLLFAAIARLRRATDQEEINRYKLAASLVIAFMLMSFSDNLLRGTIILLYYFAVIVYCLAHRPQLTEEAV